MQSVKAFPYATAGFVQHASNRSIELLFEMSSGTKQLATILNRLTYLGACELLLAPADISLLSIGSPMEKPIVGAVIERQVVSLERSMWKEGARRVVATLLRDALLVYLGEEMPVRRGRVLLRCLEFGYHGGMDFLGELGSPQSIGEEIEGLLSNEVSDTVPIRILCSLIDSCLLQDLKQDVGLSSFLIQYRASADLWLALHAHRQAGVDQVAVMLKHVEKACDRFIGLVGELPKLVSAPKGSSKLPAPIRQRSLRKITPARDPVTPKTTGRKKGRVDFSPSRASTYIGAALQSVSMDITTPPKQATEVAKSVLVFDDFERLLGLLRMSSLSVLRPALIVPEELTARILGLLGLVLPKVRVLDLIRKLCERHSGPLSEGTNFTSPRYFCS